MFKRKRYLSFALATGMLAAQLCNIAPVAVWGAGAAKATVTNVEIGSDVWETPVIPDAAVSIPGVDRTEISLNETKGDGTWKFLYKIPDYTAPDGVPAPTAAKQDFDFSKWAGKEWKNIAVPGEALMQGFDVLTNNEYYYQRQITVPQNFAGNRVLLRFDGVYSNARVWINGRHVKTHVGGFTTWDCDLTDYAKPGETVTLTLGVAELYATTKGIWNPEGKSVNNPANATEYAHHDMLGILRDVSLVAVPRDYIARVYVNTDFDAGFTDADLEVTAQLGLVSKKAQLFIELLDGNSVVTSAVANFTASNSSGLTAAKKVTIPVKAPKHWDAEHPNLYTLRTSLLVGGVKKQVNEEKIGFREIHYGGRDGTDVNRVYVNGKEVKLRGTCRHDVSEDLGRSMTREEAYEEAEAYKKANINFIRTSHYPISEHMLDACDELGIYVEQETAVCFQGPWGDVASKYEDFGPQFTEMVERDRNRPSILIWSLGNESNYSKVVSQSGGDAFGDERAYLEDVDRTRPCIFSFPNTGEPDGLKDIYSDHYASVTGGLGSSTMPRLHDEYAHIPCYNLDELQRDVNVRNFWGESVKKAWENIFVSDGALGGALWGGIDDVFYIPEGTQERWQSHSSGQTAGYGEWGSVLDAYLREKPEAWLTKKAYSPIRVDEEECYISGETMYIPVKNWFDHTNMNEVRLEYTVNGETQKVSIAQSIEPHKEGIIKVGGISGSPDSVNLKFYTSDGLMADEYQVDLNKASYSFTPPSDVTPTIADTTEAVTVSGDEFSVAFGKETGLIEKAEFGGKTMITGGPYLHVTGMSLGDWTPDEEEGIQVTEEDNCAVATMKGSYANGQGVEFTVRISGNGILATDYKLTTEPKTTSGLSEVGVSYDIPFDMESVSWLRDGLYSAYPEDHIGRNEGTALKVRKNSDTDPDRYGVTPSWPWKDDMMNYFVWATDDPCNGIATNDFRSMRENVYYYNVNYGTEENAPRISVESEKASVSARVDLSYDYGYIDDRDPRVKYDENWAPYDSGSDYAGTETYSKALGASCELSFEGTGIRFIGSKQANVGKVKIYIDGEFKEEVDTFNELGGGDLKQTEIYRIENLAKGTHKIKLETSGGHANCIVVDAFEILGNDGVAKKVVAKLVIDNQWYYPNLGWGNYTGRSGTLAKDKTGTATIRLTDKTNMGKASEASLSRVRVSEAEEGTLKVDYDLRNADDGMEVSLQWYKVRVGDPDSKRQAIEGATKAALSTDGQEGNRISCVVSLKQGDVEMASAASNSVQVGDCRYHDIVEDSNEFVFEGTIQTDSNKSHTQNAFGKTVTYLMADQASVTYTFTGSGIRWLGAKENNQGIASVFIDGGSSPEKIDLYGTTGTGNQVNEILYEKTWGEVGEHTIKILRTGDKNGSSSGAYVSLDAFIVTNEPVQVTGVNLNAGELRLAKGGSGRLTAAVLPVDAANRTVTFTSNNARVATVDEEGTVTAVGAGEAVITATTAEGRFTAVCIVKVSEAPVGVTGVTLDAEELNLKEGERGWLTATVLPKNTESQDVMFTTSDGAVATVNAEGEVTAEGTGEAVITVTTVEGGFTAACTVKVAANPQSPVTEEDLEKAQADAAQAKAAEAAAKDALNKANQKVAEAQKAAAEAEKLAEEKAKAIAENQKATEQQRQEAQAAQKELETTRAALAKAQAEAKKAQNQLEKLNFQAKKMALSKVAGTKKKTAKATWKKVSGATGYQIQYALKSNFKGKKTVTVKGGKKTSGTIKKLKSGKKYYVRVRAYKKIGSQNAYTKFSSTKSVKVK